MAIFNSYVSLPEGIHIGETRWPPHLWPSTTPGELPDDSKRTHLVGIKRKKSPEIPHVCWVKSRKNIKNHQKSGKSQMVGGVNKICPEIGEPVD